MNSFDLERWCAGIAKLQRTDTALWNLSDPSGVSYPESGHTSIAEVEDRSFWFRHRNAVIAAAARNFPPGDLLFDIGGGNGYVSVGLRDAGFASVVVEPGSAGATNALARGFPVIHAPFQDLEIPSSSIPAIGLFDVLEHIEDDLSALESLYRVLMPGGRLYVAVPSYRWLWSVEDVHAGHFRRYRLAELQQHLAQAGFVVEYGTYFFGLLVGPLLALRALPSFLGIAKVNSNVAQDHRLPSGIIGRLFQRSFNRELARVRAGGRVAFGTSCLAVARKPGG